MRRTRPSVPRLVLILAACAALLAPAALAGSNRFVFVGDSGQHIEGEAGWLGVRVDDAGGTGARIVSVVEDSPAARAGLQADDVILRVDGTTTSGAGSLTQQIREQEPGRRVTLGILRDGREIEIDAEIGDFGAMISERVQAGLSGLDLHLEGLEESMGRLHEQLGELHGHGDFDFEGLEKLKDLGHLEHLSELGEHLGQMGHVFLHDCGDGDCKGMVWRSDDRPMLGVSLTTTTPELRRHLGSDDDSGALVGRVVPDSAAEAAGIAVGDLIVAIDGDRVAGAGDIRRALAGKAGETVRVDVIREGAPLTLYAELPRIDSDKEPVLQRTAPARGPRT